MVNKCPICKKRFVTMYPHLWAYRRGSLYICSWKCLRAYDKQFEGENETMKHSKVTLESKKKAVEIALAGGDPLSYLRQCGAGDPTQMWYAIKQKLKESDLEIYEKLPKRIAREKDEPLKAFEEVKKQIMEIPQIKIPQITVEDAMQNCQDAADTFFNACEEMGLKVHETEEDFEVTAIRDKQLGEFYYDHDHNSIDWRDGVGDEISLGVAGWKILLEKLPVILRKLGVEP